MIMAECNATSDQSVDGQLTSEDTIEGTVFSKSWVFALLVRLVDYVRSNNRAMDSDREDGSLQECELVKENDIDLSPSEDNARKCTSSPLALQSGKVAEDDLKRMDEGLENELCKLWDASMNVNMSLFLHQYNVVDVLVGSVRRSKCSRVTEICVGIIGNMVCNRKISHEAIGTTSSQDFFVCLMNQQDSSVLIEVIRLILTCLSHTEETNSWLNAISSSLSFFDDVVYILQNSTNGDLLRILSTLLDKLLDVDDSLCSKWSCQPFISAVCEGSDQCRLSAIDVSCTLMLLLQSLTTTKEGVEAIVCADCVSCHLPLLLQSMSLHCEELEAHNNSRRGLLATLSLCECILDHTCTSASEKTNHLKNLMKESNDVFSFVQKLSSNGSSIDCEEDVCWNTVGSDSQWDKAENDGVDSFIVEETKRLAGRILILLDS